MSGTVRTDPDSVAVRDSQGRYLGMSHNILDRKTPLYRGDREKRTAAETALRQAREARA